MILRNIQRRPGRTISSAVGISFAAAMLIVGLFFIDSIDVLMDVQFNLLQRQDVTVTFVEPRSARAFYELEHLPGVIYTEPLRSVPARLRHGHRYRQTAITGLTNGAELNRVLDAELEPVTLPSEGLVLSSKLAEILEIERGDVVTLEVLEAGHRRPGAHPGLDVPRQQRAERRRRPDVRRPRRRRFPEDRELDGERQLGPGWWRNRRPRQRANRDPSLDDREQLRLEPGGWLLGSNRELALLEHVARQQRLRLPRRGGLPGIQRRKPREPDRNLLRSC